MGMNQGALDSSPFHTKSGQPWRVPSLLILRILLHRGWSVGHGWRDWMEGDANQTSWGCLTCFLFLNCESLATFLGCPQMCGV
jgi:hypothetical protein